MKKLVIMGMTLLVLGGLSGCGKPSKDDGQAKTETVKSSALDDAKMNVNSLFTGSSHKKLLEGTTLEMIESIEKDVKKLKPSKTKTKLLADVKKAKKLWPAFEKSEKKRAAVESSESVERLNEEEASKSSKAAEKASKKVAKEQEKKDAESSSKAESKSIADADAASKSAADAKYKSTYPGTKNHVYGKLTDKEFHRDPKTALFITDDDATLNYVQIMVTPDTKQIRRVHLDFADTPLSPAANDWKDWLPDWIEADAVNTGKEISNTEWQFTSASIGKTYKVKLTWNDEPAVTHVYIMEQ